MNIKSNKNYKKIRVATILGYIFLFFFVYIGVHNILNVEKYRFTIFIFFVMLTLLNILLFLHKISWISLKDQKQASNTTIKITKDNIYFKELHFLMKEARIYRDATLGLDSIAKRLDISSV